MKIFIRQLPLLFGFLLCLISCKKDNNEPAFQSYLRYKLDGVQVESNAHIKATYLPPTIGPDKVITISGDWSGGSISLYLNESQVLAAGQYLFDPFTWRTGEVWASGPGGRYYIGGSCLGCATVTGSGKVIITEINAEYVKGSFEFVTGVDAATSTFKTVTDGEFHIKRD